MRGFGFFGACAAAIVIPSALLIVIAGVRAPLWEQQVSLLQTRFDRFVTPEAALGSRFKADIVDVAGMRGVDSGIEHRFDDDTVVTLLELASASAAMPSVEQYLASLGSFSMSGGSDQIRFRLKDGPVGHAAVAGRVALVVRGPSLAQVDARMERVPAFHANVNARNWANWLLDDHWLVLVFGLLVYAAGAVLAVRRIR